MPRIYFTGEKSYMQNLVVIYKLRLPSSNFFYIWSKMQGKEDLVRADLFGWNKLELGYDRIDAMLYTGQLTGPGTEQEINANRMGIWCTLKVWRLEISASISSNHEGMISAYFAQRKNLLLSIKNAGVRSLITPFLWFLFFFSQQRSLKEYVFLVSSWTSPPLLLRRCICFLFLFLEKMRGCNQSVGEYSNSGSARLYRRPIKTEM